MKTGAIILAAKRGKQDSTFLPLLELDHVSVIRRVCGYLGSPDARPFNAGKQEEVKRRVKHLNNGQLG